MPCLFTAHTLPAYALPMACPYPAYTLFMLCLYPVYAMPIYCPYPACLHPAYTLSPIRSLCCVHCCAPSADGVRLNTWRGDWKRSCTQSSYAVYLYLYRCGCTYWVTLRVFSWGTLQQMLSNWFTFQYHHPLTNKETVQPTLRYKTTFKQFPGMWMTDRFHCTHNLRHNKERTPKRPIPSKEGSFVQQSLSLK